MNDPAALATRRPSAPSLLSMLLAVALLAPVAVLFGQVWSDVDGERSAAARERDGISYLRALTPVTVALADAQASAVTGQPVARDALDRAVREAATVDARIGAELRTTERWAGLRSRIESLPARPAPDPRVTFTIYQEATDLLLALYAKVQSGSGLVRDPDTDAAQLQQAAARDLPAALIGAARLTGVTVLAPNRPAEDRSSVVADLTAARLATFAAVQDLITHLQEAIDSTRSTNLGGNLLSRLDAYQRALGTLSSAVTPPSEQPATGARRAELPDPATVAAARVTAQTAGADLTTIILAELDTLVEERADRLDTRRWTAAVTAAVAVLLAVVTAARTMRAPRRYRRTVEWAAPAGAGEADDELPGAARSAGPRAPAGGKGRGGERWQLAGGTPEPPVQRRTGPTDWQEPVPVGPNARPSNGTVRDNQPAHWSRTDAAR